ncbi:MAG: hypothetical protein RLZZ204_713 [Bacteroidota bacterium]|jgi:hypothetical protein
MSSGSSSSNNKKEFKEYFLEFLMLFAAVTLGFFAENIREFYGEREMEEKFIEVVIEDIDTDINSLKGIIKSQEKRILYEDSLIYLLAKRDFSNMNNLYYYARVTSLRNFFQPSINGFQQLKNAGGLKMIEQHDVIKKIQHYENEVQKLIELQTISDGLLNVYRDKMATIFDGRVFKEMFINPNALDIYEKFQKPLGNPTLIENNEKDINELLIRAIYINTNANTSMKRYRLLLSEAESLKASLQASYE